jgi:hypothetical protein
LSRALVGSVIYALAAGSLALGAVIAWLARRAPRDDRPGLWTLAAARALTATGLALIPFRRWPAVALMAASVLANLAVKRIAGRTARAGSA